jgi:hypothetical protein
LTDDVSSVDPSLLGTDILQSQACTTDYIVIAFPGQLINGLRTPIASDRFCGMGIGVINAISTFGLTQTYSVRSLTDSNENLDLGNRGFYLIYTQGGCFP